MFTIAQIKEAHSKVKSGADFPAYIQDLIALGVKGYTTFVNDGHVDYFGSDTHTAASAVSYENIIIATSVSKERFIEFLVMHQDGQTDYFTFCNHAAQCGIAQWSVDIIEMTCTYLDQFENVIIIEKIPT